MPFYGRDAASRGVSDDAQCSFCLAYHRRCLSIEVASEYVIDVCTSCFRDLERELFGARQQS